MSSYLEKILQKTLTGSGDSDKHLMTLFSIAVSINAKNILELGVRNGDTSLPLLLAASLNNGNVKSVDVNPTVFKCPTDFKKYWKFYQTDALEFLNRHQQEKYDLIYVDDWHSYEHVKKELEYIDRMITPSSIVVLHDLMYGNTCPYYHVDLTTCSPQWENGGPYRAVAELNPNFWEFSTIPSNNGLTILRKKYSSKY